ncbi:hypothetical protein DSECCO2_77450 [anaerobic digester metagenome]
MSDDFLYAAIKGIIDGNAILITGSGASWGAKNVDGENFPSGYKLASNIYKKCKLPEGDDIRDAADTYIEMYSSQLLIRDIKRLLTVASVETWHEVVFSQNWRTVYTTNYDEVPILAAGKKNKNLNPITLDMEFRKNVSLKNKCVYINGYIGSLSESTLNTQFKLNSNSYQSSDNISNSQWGSLLNDDIESSSYVFIVGLSLEYDLDLERILKYSQDTKNKIIIITNGIDSVASAKDKSDHGKKIRKLGRFGSVYEIGIEGFANVITSVSVSYTPKVNSISSHIYTCFKHSFRKEVTPVKPGSITILNYYMFGVFDTQLMYRERGRATGVIYRKEVEEILNYIKKNKKIIFLHSYFGNGKTGILDLLKVQISKEKMHVYDFLKDYPSSINADIDAICATEGRKIIIIEDFPNSIHILKKLSVSTCEDTTLILTARTGLMEAISPEVCGMFNVGDGEAFTIDANKLNHQELVACDSIFYRYGFWGLYSGKTSQDRIKLLKRRGFGNSSLQSILLIAFKSEAISKKLDAIVDQIRNCSERYFEVLILAMISRIMNLGFSVRDINEIMDADTMRDVNFVSNSAVKEIILPGDSEFSFRLNSSVVANKILQSSTTASIIVSVLYRAAAFAIKYSRNQRYENILRYIISFSLITTFTNDFDEKESFIQKYYEDLSSLDYYSKSHFFWLQYAMACIDIANTSKDVKYYNLAQQYIDTAYGLSKELNNFVPFQINNQQAKLLLRTIEDGFSKDIKADFKKAHSLLKLPISSNKDNPVAIIKLFTYYTKKSFIKNFNNDELKKMLCDYCAEGYNIVISLCKKIPENERAQFEALKFKLMKTKFLFASSPLV